MVDLTGLAGLFDKFDKLDNHETVVRDDKWKITKGELSLLFEVYYEDIPVIRCKNGRLINITMNAEDYKKTSSVIMVNYKGKEQLYKE